MQIKQTLLRTLLILLPFSAFSQTTFLPQDDKAYITMDRFEIKSQTDSFFNFSKNKPFSRQHVVNAVSHYLQTVGNDKISKIDAYNADRIFINNQEWLSDANRLKYASKKPIWKNFYKTPANLYEVHTKDFDLIVNPVLQFSVSKEKDNNETLFLNSRGLTVRGKIANKIGFYTFLTDNQERDPLYVQDWVNKREAVPGAGNYKIFKTSGYDYFDARGGITFNVTKYINVAFAYDRNFIGNGYRSLMLGDQGNSNLFLKLNTRIWKINYQNLFMELHNTEPRIGDHLIGKKYAAIHHLDVSVTKWLNVGLYEGVIFGRKDHFEFGYLNPIIFYRSIEFQNGSFDNSLAGLDFKANVAKKFQFYGQFVLDEFILSEITKNTGYWANKWSLQLGAKYVDAFGIKNLDLQLEHNRVRPFTYSHNDSVANYTHYNQPLAHPLGANFKETIGIVKYQPAIKWLIVGKLIAYTQGRDSSNRSFGSNIFLPNQSPYRVGDYGYKIGSGWKTDVLYGSLEISYELRENMILELTATHRKQDTKTIPVTTSSTSFVSFGLRWNMNRKVVDY